MEESGKREKRESDGNDTIKVNTTESLKSWTGADDGDLFCQVHHNIHGISHCISVLFEIERFDCLTLCKQMTDV